MRQYDIGILPVVENERVVGVITDRDIVTRSVAQNKPDSCVCDCMSKSTVWANPTQNVKTAVKTMAAQQIRRVPIMENGSLCGILSVSDVVKNGFDTEIATALCEISKP
jgi:CBS domain-containing protein